MFPSGYARMNYARTNDATGDKNGYGRDDVRVPLRNLHRYPFIGTVWSSEGLPERGGLET